MFNDEHAGSVLASAVQAACPSAPLSMFGLPALPTTPVCTHTRIYARHHIQHDETHNDAHTAEKQVVYLLSACPLPHPESRRCTTLACTYTHAHTHKHTHTLVLSTRSKKSYRQATAQRATGSGPRPVPLAQQGPRRSCHILPPHHPPISARMG